MLLAVLILTHHAAVPAPGMVELSGPCQNAQPLAGPLRCTSAADCSAQCDKQAAAVNRTRHDPACVAVDTDGQYCWLRASCDGKPGSCVGPTCGYRRADDHPCANFSGVWTTQNDGKGIAYFFRLNKHVNGSCSIETPTCPKQPVGNGTHKQDWRYSVYAQGNVIHTCKQFHGGVAGVLQLQAPRDRLHWATGTSWWRLHDVEAPPPLAPPSPPPLDIPSHPTVWKTAYEGGPWTAVIDDMTSQSVECVGGASFSSWPRGQHAVMRGGSRTDTRPMCRLKVPAPEKVRTVVLSYKYVAGYNCTNGCTRATVLKLLAADANSELPLGHGLLYKSAPLNQANGDECNWDDTCYKQVDVNAGCKQCEGRYFTFVFENDRHNVQLLLPISITINEDTGCHPKRKPYEPPTAHQARACALAHTRKECSRLNQTCVWDSFPDSDGCKGFGCLRIYGLPIILCGLCLLLVMVGTVQATRKGTKREASLLSTSPNDDDGAKRQRVDPTMYVADPTASHRTPPESQITQSEISSANWSCGSTDVGASAASLPQDDDLTGVFAQSCFDEGFDSGVFEETIGALGYSAGLGDSNVSVEPALPSAHNFADVDQAAFFGGSDDHNLQTEDLNVAELEGADCPPCPLAGGWTGEKYPTHPKKPADLRCWREGCSYTTTQQRHLDAHEAR